MVSLMSLVLPVLLSAVFVFIASSLIHMVIKYHASDYNGFSNEDEIRQVMLKGNPQPKQYIIPWCGDMKKMATPEMQAKYQQGPMAAMWLGKPGIPNIGRNLIQWFIFSIIVGFFSAYVGSNTLGHAAPSGMVMRITGTVAFAGYALAQWADTIWKFKPVASSIKYTIDGLIYGLITGATFGWLWPDGV